MIDFSQIDFDAEAAGVQHLTFIGGAAFTGAGGSDYELQVTGPAQPGGAIRVSIDLDNDAVADRVITVTADAPLTADDFVLAPPAQAFAAASTAAFAAPLAGEAAATQFAPPSLRMDWLDHVCLV